MDDQYTFVQEYIKEYMKKKKRSHYRNLNFQDIQDISNQTSDEFGQNISMEYILQSIGMLTVADEKNKKKPSDFMDIIPCNNILGIAEAELIAFHIMKILERTRNEFRNITWEEYSEERKKDTDFLESEICYFEEVAKYFISADAVELFSPDWKKFGGPLT